MSKLENVICIPFAGAGASAINDFKKRTDKLNLIPVQLPGREKKFLQPLATNVHDVIDELVEDAVSRLDGSGRAFIFGHSLGAIVGYELTKKLMLRSDITIPALIVSGSPGPWNLREQKATGLPDQEFIEAVQGFASFHDTAMSDPAILDLVLPILRADVQMHEEYRPRETAPIPVPIISIRGSEDGLVSDEDAATWSEATTRSVDCRIVKGGHMYLLEEAEGLISILETAVELFAGPAVER